MYSPFSPPSREAHAEINDLVRRMRCFDANMRARVDGYHAPADANLYDLPVVDPNGQPWTLLSAEELEARKQWCMLPEMHDALYRELDRRSGLDRFYSTDH